MFLSLGKSYFWKIQNVKWYNIDENWGHAYSTVEALFKRPCPQNFDYMVMATGGKWISGIKVLGKIKVD